MKNIRIVIVCLLSLALVAGAAIYFMNSQTAQTRDSEADQTTANTVVSSNESAPKTAVASGYVDYSDDYLETTSGTRLLFFHASWCPQCRTLETDIIENGVPEDVTIIKVDYDSSQQLRQKYGVTIQTTVVRVDDQGELVGKYTPYDEPTLDNVAANLL